MLRDSAGTGTAMNVTACLIVREYKKHPGRFRFYGTLQGDGAIMDYSSSTKPKQFRIGHIACHIYGTFDYLNYPYYPAYTG